MPDRDAKDVQQVGVVPFRDAIERLHVQLAGCLTAAEGATAESEVAKPADYGWSVPYAATLKLRRAFDRIAGGRSPDEVLAPPADRAPLVPSSVVTESGVGRPSFEATFMALAFALARRSTCARLQVGCVIVSADWRAVFGLGYNGGAAGQENACASTEPGLCGHLHAEDNAIVNGFGSASRGVRKVVVCTHLPCLACCKRLVNLRDVDRVYFARGYRSTEGAVVLQRADIELTELSGPWNADEGT